MGVGIIRFYCNFLSSVISNAVEGCINNLNPTILEKEKYRKKILEKVI